MARILNKTKNITIFNFFLDCIQNFKWLILGQITVSIIWAIDLSLRPYLLKILIDKISNISSHGAFQTLISSALLYVFMTIVNFLNVIFNDYVWLRMNSDLKKHVAIKLIDTLMMQSYIFYQDKFAGSLSSKINDIMNAVPDLTKIFIEKFLGYIFALTIAIYTISQTSASIAITLVTWVVIYIVLTIKVNSYAKEICQKTAESRSKVIGYLVDVLSNMSSVRFFNAENWEITKCSKLFEKYNYVYKTRSWFFIKLFSLQGISFIIYQSICLFWLIVGLKNHTITPGDVVLVITLNILIIDFLKVLSKDINTFTELIANVNQGLAIIYTEPEIQDKPTAKDLIITNGQIIFDKVKFSYGKGQLIFNETSVIIEPNQKIGLVGYTGSGKSTFAKLILRLFNVTSGRILIDNQDINEVTQESLRRFIGIVPQDSFLFHRNLMENIKYGKVTASDEEVIKAAKRAHAHEFISKLPHGYDSLVGERGVKLSGGQRQRIGIARAILKNAPILILDEATSHLDTVTESLVQKSFMNLMENKTTIVIAHRLSTLLHMDRILVFHKGKIIADGGHKDLLRSSAFYKKLWNMQIGGLLPQGELINNIEK